MYQVTKKNRQMCTAVVDLMCCSEDRIWHFFLSSTDGLARWMGEKMNWEVLR